MANANTVIFQLASILAFAVISEQYFTHLLVGLELLTCDVWQSHLAAIMSINQVFYCVISDVLRVL